MFVNGAGLCRTGICCVPGSLAARLTVISRFRWMRYDEFLAAESKGK
jgi:hypothetical protein